MRFKMRFKMRFGDEALLAGLGQGGILPVRSGMTAERQRWFISGR